MTEAALILIILTLISVACLIRRSAPPPNELRRLNPGVAHHAEWMASEATVSRVGTDYLAAHAWMVTTLLRNTVTYLHEVPRYYSGSALCEQQRVVNIQLHRRGPRLVGIMRARHRVQARRFSDDGLTCYLIDHQTERRMTTYDYWSKRRLHTQDLDSGMYVYQMVFDRADGRWKIAELMQQLPIGLEQFPLATAPIQLTDELPSSAGRDL